MSTSYMRRLAGPRDRAGFDFAGRRTDHRREAIAQERESQPQRVVAVTVTARVPEPVVATTSTAPSRNAYTVALLAAGAVERPASDRASDAGAEPGVSLAWTASSRPPVGQADDATVTAEAAG